MRRLSVVQIPYSDTCDICINQNDIKYSVVLRGSFSINVLNRSSREETPHMSSLPPLAANMLGIV